MSTPKKATKSGGKTGRPKEEIERVTISFRIPNAAEEAVKKLAEDETAKTPGRTVKPSDIYNQALAEFLTKHKVKIAGWNTAAA